MRTGRADARAVIAVQKPNPSRISIDEDPGLPSISIAMELRTLNTKLVTPSAIALRATSNAI
jgi:hypothetical protein